MAVVFQVLAGAVLLLLGDEAPDGLHYVYGLLPLLVTLLAEGARDRQPPSASSPGSTSTRCPRTASG